jgi:hypothetical protein
MERDRPLATLMAHSLAQLIQSKSSPYSVNQLFFLSGRSLDKPLHFKLTQNQVDLVKCKGHFSFSVVIFFSSCLLASINSRKPATSPMKRREVADDASLDASLDQERYPFLSPTSLMIN